MSNDKEREAFEKWWKTTEVKDINLEVYAGLGWQARAALAHSEESVDSVTVKDIVVLNGKEILDLAMLAGFSIVGHDYTQELETEWVVAECPTAGIIGDEGEEFHSRYIVYLEEYPEEGCSHLGDLIESTGEDVS